MPFAMNEPFSVAEKSTRRGRENGGSKVDSLDQSGCKNLFGELNL